MKCQRLIGVMLLWLAVVVTSIAGEVKIVGDAKVPVFEFARYTAEGAPEGSGYSWKVFDGKRNRLSSKSVEITGNKLKFVAAPGDYRVELSVFSYDEKTKQITVVDTDLSVAIVGNVIPEPQPNPDPNPDPKPNPVVDLKDAGILVIEETSEATVNRGKWISDKPLQDYVRNKKWTATIVDKDVKDGDGKVPENFNLWLKLTSGKKLPYAFIFTPKGKIAWQGELPEKPVEFLAILKKLGGDK